MGWLMLLPVSKMDIPWPVQPKASGARREGPSVLRFACGRLGAPCRIVLAGMADTEQQGTPSTTLASFLGSSGKKLVLC